MKLHRSNAQIACDRQSGLSMLEVLIALAVLSIGLAGVAIMHLNALKYTKAAYERSIASAIALDLEERLWLQVADTSSIGCPSLDVDSGVVSELISHWTTATASTTDGQEFIPAKIPDLTISIEGTPTIVGTAGSEPAYAEVDIRLSWGSADEQMFQNETDTRMTFDYTARIYCSADYVTTIPAS